MCGCLIECVWLSGIVLMQQRKTTRNLFWFAPLPLLCLCLCGLSLSSSCFLSLLVHVVFRCGVCGFLSCHAEMDSGSTTRRNLVQNVRQKMHNFGGGGRRPRPPRPSQNQQKKEQNHHQKKKGGSFRAQQQRNGEQIPDTTIRKGKVQKPGHRSHPGIGQWLQKGHGVGRFAQVA